MNRNEEYNTLLRELDQTPPELEYTVTRAKARARRHQARRWVGVPVGTLAGAFAAFVLLVNTVPTFALACSHVPVLGDLAGKFIRFDTTGLDFALTGLFVVLFIEQVKNPENRRSGVIGMACTVAALAVFGADKLVIPAMILVLVVLLLGRKKL